MDSSHIAALLLQYRYLILIPLSLLEGPIVAFIAGGMAATGYFNIFALGVFFYARDMILDGAYYALGHFGGKTNLVHRMLARLSISEEHLVAVRGLWEKRPAMTMLIGKLSYGIASTFIVIAGMLGMPLTTFFFYGSLAALAQYGTLLVAGYYLGAAFGGEAIAILEHIQYVLLIAGVVLVGYYWVALRMRKEFLKEEHQEEVEEDIAS